MRAHSWQTRKGESPEEGEECSSRETSTKAAPATSASLVCKAVGGGELRNHGTWKGRGRPTPGGLYDTLVDSRWGGPLVCVSKCYLTIKTLHQLCGHLVVANVRDFCLWRGALNDFPCIFHICGSLTVDSCCCWVNRVLASYRLWLLLLTKTTSLGPWKINHFIFLNCGES